MTAEELAKKLMELPEEQQKLQVCYYDLEDGTLTISKVQLIEPQGTDPRFQHEPYIQLV